MKPKALLKFTAAASRIASASFSVFIGGECGASRSQGGDPATESEAHRAGARARGGSPGRRRPTFRGAATAALLALFALAVALDASAQSAHKTESGLLVRDTTLAPEDWVHGMAVHRFVIENPSNRRRGVSLWMPATHYGSGSIESMTARLVIESGSSAAVAMPQPPIPLSGGQDMRVSERGYDDLNVNLSAGNVQRGAYWGNTQLPQLLLSRALSAETLATTWHACLEAWLKRQPQASVEAASAFKPTRTTLNPEAWPQTWLDFSTFDGCFVAEEDYRRFTAETQRALIDYAAAGGTVVLVGFTTPTPEWQEHIARPSDAPKGLAIWPLGHGRLALVQEKDPAAWSGEIQETLLSGFLRTRQPWATTTTTHFPYTSNLLREAKESIPLGIEMGVPVNAFFALLLVFAVVAGPVAVRVAAKYNRRMWLLWAVPAFGFLFSGAIFAGILVFEGVSPTMRRQAITLLDQPNRHAATLGAVGVYTPGTLRGGIAFEHGTEITPVNPEAGGRIEFGTRQVYSDWVPPRMAAFFRLRRSETRAERLVVERKDDGALEVVNALGAPIERLRLWDDAGVLHEATDIPPGARQALKPLGASETGPGNLRQPQDVHAWASEYLYATESPGWAFPLRDTGLRNISFPPTPRAYVAHLAGCPFIENPLEGRRSRGTQAAIVIGRY